MLITNEGSKFRRNWLIFFLFDIQQEYIQEINKLILYFWLGIVRDAQA